jgi:hypothetical protein
MKNWQKHVIQQPFVFATGLAALVHSTWSLGTLFSGEQPPAGFTTEYLGWLIPAFLIAFALDVGQIVTSAEIRAGKRGFTKYATFAVFALATYYLQWLYIAHHMPALELAPGVRETWAGSAQLIRDAAIWFIPALLPLSTLLYTFSSGEVDHPAQAEPLAIAEPEQLIQVPANRTILVEELERLALQEGSTDDAQTETKLAELVRQLPSGKWYAECPDCGTWSKAYETLAAAERGLRAHQSLHCTARVKPELVNGHKPEPVVDLPQWLIDQDRER